MVSYIWIWKELPRYQEASVDGCYNERWRPALPENGMGIAKDLCNKVWTAHMSFSIIQKAPNAYRRGKKGIKNSCSDCSLQPQHGAKLRFRKYGNECYGFRQLRHKLLQHLQRGAGQSIFRLWDGMLRACWLSFHIALIFVKLKLLCHLLISSPSPIVWTTNPFTKQGGSHRLAHVW